MGEGGAVNIVAEPANSRPSSRAFATGAATAGAPAARTTPAANASTGNWANCPRATTTNTFTPISATTSSRSTFRPPSAAVQLQKLPAFIQARIDNWNYLAPGPARSARNASISCCPPTPPPGRPKDLPGTTPAIEPFAPGLVSCCASNPARLSPKLNWPGILTRRKSATACSSAATLSASRPSSNSRRTAPKLFASWATWQAPTRIMNEALFIGTYPGLTRQMLDYMVEAIHEFCRGKLTMSANRLSADLDHVLPETGPLWEELRGGQAFRHRAAPASSAAGCWKASPGPTNGWNLDAEALVLTRNPAAFGGKRRTWPAACRTFVSTWATCAIFEFPRRAVFARHPRRHRSQRQTERGTTRG